MCLAVHILYIKPKFELMRESRLVTSYCLDDIDGINSLLEELKNSAISLR